MKKALILATSAIVLTACGGGGGGDGSSGNDATAKVSAPAGLYAGKTDTNRDVKGIVRSNGDVWFVYSDLDSPLADGVEGIITGNGTATNSGFTITAKDYQFYYDSIVDASITSSYIAGQYINADIKESSGAQSAVLSYDSDFDATPSLATLAGSYNGESMTMVGLSGTPTVVISADGSVNASDSSGCIIDGTAAVATDGNYYTVTLKTHDMSECDASYRGVTTKGIAYLNSNNGHLYIATKNDAGTLGYAFTSYPTT
ncbi:MAG: hypothetical protein R3292_14945 [Alcanivorax sp.]|nr:hypothetical protein [Alcanivorax sp.]